MSSCKDCGGEIEKSVRGGMSFKSNSPRCTECRLKARQPEYIPRPNKPKMCPRCNANVVDTKKSPYCPACRTAGQIRVHGKSESVERLSIPDDFKPKCNRGNTLFKNGLFWMCSCCDDVYSNKQIESMFNKAATLITNYAKGD